MPYPTGWPLCCDQAAASHQSNQIESVDKSKRDMEEGSSRKGHSRNSGRVDGQTQKTRGSSGLLVLQHSRPPLSDSPFDL